MFLNRLKTSLSSLSVSLDGGSSQLAFVRFLKASIYSSCFTDTSLLTFLQCEFQYRLQTNNANTSGTFCELKKVLVSFRESTWIHLSNRLQISTVSQELVSPPACSLLGGNSSLSWFWDSSNQTTRTLDQKVSNVPPPKNLPLLSAPNMYLFKQISNQLKTAHIAPMTA